MNKRFFTTENKDLAKLLLKIGLPLALQSLISASLSLVDNLLVSHLGEVSLAATGLSSQIIFIFWMLLWGFTGGAITYMAQFFGIKDLQGVRHTAGIGLIFTISMAIIFFIACFFFPHQVLSIFTNIPEVLKLGTPFIRISAFTFIFLAISVVLNGALKSKQLTKYPLIIGSFTFALNTILCIFLINGIWIFPKMGILGACTATLISRVIECCLYIYLVLIRQDLLGGNIREYFSFPKVLFYKVMSNALPTCANETLWSLGASMYNAAYGRLGASDFAAVQAAGTINNIFGLVCFSMGEAMLIIVGEKLGAGLVDDAIAFTRKMLKIVVCVAIVFGLLLIVSSRYVVLLFSFSDTTAHATVLTLIVYGAFLWLKSYNSSAITGALRAGGDTKYAMLGEIGSVWLVGVPIAFIAALLTDLPIYLIVLCVQAEECVKALIMRHRVRSLKWANDLVKNL